jgi:hypothetical protein
MFPDFMATLYFIDKFVDNLYTYNTTGVLKSACWGREFEYRSWYG